MIWKKLGKIFDPTKHRTLPNCTEFAQSPQALVFDDFVRIYFSTRESEWNTGKFLSHVSFVDMTKDFSKIVNHATKPVVHLGCLGAFDEHGIFPLNVLRVEDKVYGYTCGWSRRVSVSVETSIGLVISHDDGETFERIADGPVLGATLREPCLVGDGFVRLIDGRFHMWYIFGWPWQTFTKGHPPDRIYKIGHATSADGVTWEKDEGQQIIPDAIGPEECQALPTVIQRNGQYHMYFCFRYASDFRQNSSRAYRIGYAWSDDLETWTRSDKDAGIQVSLEANAWDSEMMCYPHAFECDQKTYLLYNGNQFGRQGFGIAVATNTEHQN